MLLVATAIMSFGRQLFVLVIGRLLQGMSAAVAWTSGLALLTDIFGEDRYGEAVSYAQAAVSVGTTCAPLLGGLVYSEGGYSAVSAMSLGTVTVSIALALMMVEPNAKSGWEGSLPGRSIAGNRSRSMANNHHQTAASREISRPGRTTRGPKPPGPASGQPDEESPLLERKVGTYQNRSAYPLLLRSGRILAAMGGIFTLAFVTLSFEGLIPLFVKETFYWDAKRAALIFLSWIIPSFLAPLAGRASDRFGPRWIAIAGFLFAVPPLFCMRFVTQDSTPHKVLLCTLLSLVGKCSCVLFPRALFFIHEKTNRTDQILN